MDSSDPHNSAAGGNGGAGAGVPRDLWKTVLDEVATDAAARRARMVQRQGDKRTVAELDLLKRILIAVEARGDQSVMLKRILDEVQGGKSIALAEPLAAIQAGIDALAKKLATRPKKAGDDAESAAAISSAVVDALQPLLTRPSDDAGRAQLIAEVGKLLEQRASEQHARLQQELAQQLAKLPAPPVPAAPQVPRDPKPELDAILAAVQSTAARDHAAELARQQSALLKSILETVQRKPDDTQAALLRDLAAKLDALPRAADHTPQLQAILDALRALPAAPAAEPDPQQAARFDAMAQQLESLLKQGQAIQQQAQSLAKATESQSARTDALAAKAEALTQRSHEPDFAKLNAILDELKRRPAADHTDALRQIAQQLEALGSVKDQGAKLDAVVAALQTLPRQDAQPVLQEILAILKAPRSDQALLAKVDEALAAAKAAAQPQLGAKLDELLETIRAPKADPHAEILARIHDAVTKKGEAAPTPAGPDYGPRFDELISRMTTLESSRPFEAKLDQIATEARAKTVKDDELLTRMLGEVRDTRTASQSALKQLADDLGKSLEAATTAITRKLELLEAKDDSGSAAALDKIDKRLSDLATDDRQLQAIGHVLTLLQTQARRGDFELLQRIAAAVDKPADAAASLKLDAILTAVEKPTDPHMAATLDQILEVLTSQPTAPRASDLEALSTASAASAAQVRDDIRAAGNALRLQVETLALHVRDDLRAQSTELHQQLAAQNATLAREAAENQQRAAAMQQQMREAVEAIHALPTQAPGQTAPADPRQLELLHEILGEVRSPTARVRQEKMLEEIAAGVRDQPAQQQDAARKITSELRQLTDANRQTQQSLQRVLDAVSSRRDTVAAAPAARVSSAASDSTVAPASAAGPRNYPWSTNIKARSRARDVTVTALAAAAIVIVMFLVIKPFLDNDGKDQRNNNVIAQGGNQPGTNQPGTNPPGTGAANTQGDGVKTPPVTDPVKVATPANGSKDGAAPKSKDSASDLAKALLPTQPVNTGDGTPIASPDVVAAVKRGITNPLGLLSVEQATQVVLLVHSSNGKGEENAALLKEVRVALNRLRDGQKYTIIFTEGDRHVEVPPAQLKAATTRERAFSEDWITRNMTGDTIRPGANPYVAIDVAVTYEPDLLWLFTDAQFAVKPGQVSPEELIQKLKTVMGRGKGHFYATTIAPAGPVAPGVADTQRLLKELAQDHGGLFQAVNPEPEKPTAGP